MKNKLLVINAGSSSMKFKLFQENNLEILAQGMAEKIFLKQSLFKIKFQEQKFEIEIEIKNHNEAVEILIKKLIDLKIIKTFHEIIGIGHRIVQGGAIFKKSCLLNTEKIKQIENLSEIAPLHNPGAVAVIRAFNKIIKNVQNVAVFDTSFHQTIPEQNYLYAVPEEWHTKYLVRKYGAHGISHKYLTQEIQKILNKKQVNIISCHLGNGASIAAIYQNKVIDTSMGLTPLAGLIMGTRSGDIDPSILSYISKKTGQNIFELTNILNTESGMLALSGISSDFRYIEKEILKGNKKAILAMDIFCQKISDFIVQYQNKLHSKVDAIIFSGGIGENSELVREKIIDKIHTMNLKIDKKINRVIIKINNKKISKLNSEVLIYVIKTNEELMILNDLILNIKKNKKEYI